MFDWHDVTKYHQDAMAKLEALKVAVNDPSASVANMLIKRQDELYENNIKVVKSLMELCVVLWTTRSSVTRSSR